MLKLNEIQIGDVLVDSWGYSMTFNDFYVVVGKKGKATLKIQKIGNKLLSGGGFTGQEEPELSRVVGEVIEKRVGKSGRLKIKESSYVRKHQEGASYYYNRMD